MSFQTWSPRVKTLMLEVLQEAFSAKETSALGEVYDFNEWPGTLTALPTALIGTRGGNTSYGASAPRILQHDMAIWVYLPGLTLAEGMAQAVPLVDRVWKKFAANLTLGSRVSNFTPPAPPAKWYEGPDFLGYGSANHVGMIFNYLVKESGESFTVEAGA